VQAAREAVGSYGFETAVEHYARALSYPWVDRIAVTIEYGSALQLIGDTETAERVLRACTQKAAASGRPIDLAEGVLALGGGIAGFEVPIWEVDHIALLQRADVALTAAIPNATGGQTDRMHALLAAVRGRLSVARAAELGQEQRVLMAEAAVAMARDSRDTVVESATLAALCDAIAGPDYVDRRTAAASRMLELAAEGPDGLRRQAGVLLARRLLVVAHLERGDLVAAARQSAAYERLADRIGTPRYRWLPEIWRGMRALIAGDPGRALQHADAAEEIGRRAGSRNAELMAFTVRNQAHLDLGTPAEFASTCDALLADLGSSGMPEMYAATPAWCLLAAGEPEWAEVVLHSLRTDDESHRPKDAEWLECHWSMAEMALSMGDQQAAEILLRELRPYESLWAVDGIGGAVFGTVAEQLSRLAAALGRSDEAAAYRDTARSRYQRAGATAFLRRVESSSLRARRKTGGSGRPPGRGTESHDGDGLLRRDGPVWTLEWRGNRSLVRDAKGMRDLAILLAHPDRGVPAVDLVEHAGGPPAGHSGGNLGPVLDEPARRAYRTRLIDLDGELDDAEAAADLGRIERLRAERSMIVDELSAALGLAGHSRMMADPAERARKAVTMRIRSAIRSIAASDEALGRHLANAVHTGIVCIYQPDSPVRWRT
jgi:hypothetical protein